MKLHRKRVYVNAWNRRRRVLTNNLCYHDRRLGNNALQHAAPRRGSAGMPSKQPIRLPPTYGLRRTGELAARLLILCAYS
jgi:hypothetical protein